MKTRRFHSADSGAAAALVALVRLRPDDCVDPFPPSVEVEVLADAGARGKGVECHPRVACEGDKVVGYGLLDYSPDLTCAQLVGPVVHPDHRGKGHGARLVADLVGQAAAARQKSARCCLAVRNAPGRRVVEAAGFRVVDKHSCLHLERTAALPNFAIEGITLQRMEYEDADEAHDYLRHIVPRTSRQTRSLLKTDDYAIVLARQGREAVGVVEVEMRYGSPAHLEVLDGAEDLIAKGLGSMLFAEGARLAFAHPAVQHLEFVVPAGSKPPAEGFRLQRELVCYELTL